MAFRYLVPAGAGVTTLQVQNEETDFAFGGDYACHGFNVGRFDSSHEGEFDPVRASLIREHNTYDLPLVCRTAETLSPSPRQICATTAACTSRAAAKAGPACRRDCRADSTTAR